jgi:hypothetical protein
MDGRSPDQVFAECLDTKRTAPAALLDLLLMKTTKPVRVAQNGVTLGGIHYGQHEPELQRRLGKMVQLRHDPADVSRVVVFDDAGRWICVADANRRLPFKADHALARQAIADKRHARRVVKEANQVRMRLVEDQTDLMILAAAARNRKAGTDKIDPTLPPPAVKPVQAADRRPLHELSKGDRTARRRRAVGADSMTLADIGRAIRRTTPPASDDDGGDDTTPRRPAEPPMHARGGGRRRGRAMSNDPRTTFDGLMDGARVQGASRMISKARPPRRSPKTRCAWSPMRSGSTGSTHKLSVAKIGKGVGYAGSVISQFLNGNYPGDVKQVAIDLDRWLEDQLKRDAAPRATDFVWTEVALEIRTVADTAITAQHDRRGLRPRHQRHRKDHGAQSDPAGEARLDPDHRRQGRRPTPPACSGRWPTRCGSAPARRTARCSSGSSNAERLAPVVDGRPGAQPVRLGEGRQGAVTLCDLHDATGAPQLWAGTQDIVAYLNRGQAKGKETLAQIRRRIGIRRDLMERTRDRGDGGKGQPLYSIEEIRKVFARNRMRLAPDAARYLWLLANLPDAGALGTCKNVVVIATTVGELKGAAALNAEMLRAAHRELVTGPAHQLLERQMEDYTPVLKVG